MSTDTIAIQEVGQPDCPTFSSYPQFVEVIAPLATLRETAMQAERAWQGLLQPFANDEDAKLVLRALAADQAVDVSSGWITAPSGTHLMRPHNDEFRMQNCAIAFDVLVLDFPAPAHPWAFSLAPIISNLKYPSHPHLRSDRTLTLHSRVLHGMCVYSAAEFQYDPALPRLPQFLHQVSIYLAKHVIWLKTLRLVNLDTGALVHDGLNLRTLYQNIPVNSIWQKHPQVKTYWNGLWPGKTAKAGKDHLSLDPEGECWCGTGLTYKQCCLIPDCQRYGLDVGWL